MTRLDFLAMALALTVGGCATPRELLHVNPETNAGIGIEIKMPRLGLQSQEPQIVYFVKLDDESNLRQPELVRSSYATNGRAYLLNVPAGDYAAVAAFYYRKVFTWTGDAAPMRALGGRLGFVTSGGNGRDDSR